MGRENTSMFSRGRNLGRKLWEPRPHRPLVCFFPLLFLPPPQHPSGRKRLERFLDTAPVRPPPPGPFYRTQNGKVYPPAFLLRAPWLGAQRQPALGQGVVASAWGQGAQLHSAFMNSREKPSFLGPLMKPRARAS